MAELAVVPHAGAFAKPLQTFGAGKSLFAGLHQHSLVSLSVRIPVSEAFDFQVLSAALVNKLEKVVDPREQQAARRLLRALEPTFRSLLFDAGAAVYRPG